MNIRSKNYRNIPLYLLSFTILLISLLASCGKPKLGDQPLLDSVYITKYMNAEPEFKDHLYWAKSFYKERSFQLGWFKEHKIVPQAGQMLEVIKKAGEEGLDPKDYQIVDFSTKFKELEDTKKSDTAKIIALEKEIDVALSATYFNWASDYYRGLVIPREHKAVEWDVKRNKIKLHKVLLTMLGDRESKYPYADFRPLHPEYANLKKALARYRDIKSKGGWPKISAGAALKKGQRSAQVPALRKRLADYLVSNPDSKGPDTANTLYDEQLEAAVSKFQEAHGLKPDGVLRAATIKALNVPVDENIRKIIINMERWRWIPKSFEPDYLMVNIPEFKLRVVEKGKEAMNMKVIVGKEMNSTPVFSDMMEYVVIAPYWNIPPGILKNEIAPKIESDNSYLERSNMEVVTNKGEPVDPSSVDWSEAGSPGFKYIVRKKPGPKNDLGDVKFIFPNVDNIYLHDTPNDELFSQAKRGFSHGCVRVERPIELAEYLLRNVPGGWNREKINQQVSTQKEKFVPLKAKLPVYLVYFTASADAKGNVSFFEDIYGHDKTLEKMYFSKL